MPAARIVLVVGASPALAELLGEATRDLELAVVSCEARDVTRRARQTRPVGLFFDERELDASLLDDVRELVGAMVPLPTAGADRAWLDEQLRALPERGPRSTRITPVDGGPMANIL